MAGKLLYARDSVCLCVCLSVSLYLSLLDSLENTGLRVPLAWPLCVSSPLRTGDPFKCVGAGPIDEAIPPSCAVRALPIHPIPPGHQHYTFFLGDKLLSELPAKGKWTGTFIPKSLRLHSQQLKVFPVGDRETQQL